MILRYTKSGTVLVFKGQRSRSNVGTVILLLLRSLWTDSRAVSVEWKDRYADCWTGRRLKVVESSEKRLTTTRSMSLERYGRLEICR